MGTPKSTRAQLDERAAHRTPSNGHQRRRDDLLRNALLALPDVEEAHTTMLNRRIVWVRTGTGTARMQWENVVATFGLDVEIVQEIGEANAPDQNGRICGRVTVYDVAGAYELDQLLRLLPEHGYSGIIKWEWAVAGPSLKHGGAVTGSGATKKK